MPHQGGPRIRPAAPRRLVLALLVAALVAAGQLPDAGIAAHGAGSGSRSGGNPTSPVAWTVRLASRFAGGKVGTWPLGSRDNGTASLSGGRYLLRATDGYTTIRAPGGLPALADGRIQATVRAVGRGNVGVYGRWYSTNGQPNLLACWFRNDGTAGCTAWQDGVPTDLGVRHGSGIHPNADNQLVLQIVKNQLQFQMNGRMVLVHTLGGQARAGAWGVYVSTTLKTAPTEGAYARVSIAVPGISRMEIAAATETAIRARQTATAQGRQTATAVAQATQTALTQAQATQTAVDQATQDTAAADAAATTVQVQLTAQAQETATAVAPLAAPQLLSPPDGSTIDVYPRVFTVSWLPVPGATSYTVTVQMCLYGITPLVYAGGYLGPCVFPTQFYGFAPTGGGWVSQSTSDGEQTTTSTSVTFGNFVGHQPGRWSVVANGPGTVSPRSAWRIIYF